MGDPIDLDAVRNRRRDDAPCDDVEVDEIIAAMHAFAATLDADEVLAEARAAGYIIDDNGDH